MDSGQTTKGGCALIRYQELQQELESMLDAAEGVQRKREWRELWLRVASGIAAILLFKAGETTALGGYQAIKHDADQAVIYVPRDSSGAVESCGDGCTLTIGQGDSPIKSASIHHNEDF